MLKRTMSSPEPRSLALAGFASPAFAIAALGLPLSAILPPLYAELGLSLTVVGTVFMLMRVFDGLTDPVFGVLGDRIQTRWGRRRPAIVAAVPILMIGVYLTFFPSIPTTETDLVISMLILYIGWTVFTIAHVAWASELTASYDGRSRVMSYLQYFGLTGSVVVLLVPIAVDVWIPNATMADRARMMGLLILVALPVAATIALVSAPEKLRSNSHQPPWQETWKIFRRSAALRRLLLADLLTGLQGGINGGVHFFFVIHVLLLPTSASLFLIAIFLTGVLWYRYSSTPVIGSANPRFASVRFSRGTAVCATCRRLVLAYAAALHLHINIGASGSDAGDGRHRR
jgi:Na+/melibiose symporter-like transporter